MPIIAPSIEKDFSQNADLYVNKSVTKKGSCYRSQMTDMMLIGMGVSAFRLNNHKFLICSVETV